MSNTTASGALRRRFEILTEPTAEGLPNRRVLLWPLAFLGVVLVALVALGITGSSTGFLNQYVNSKSDPNLIAGEPQAIRSDEWYVQTSWTISQYEQGLPIVNDAFPGGMDATVQHDLPSLDWSIAFRPHLLGFLVLPLDNAMALKWWLPGFALMAAVYLFFVSLAPRRPVTAALVSVGFFFAPFFQWWFLSITFWPAAWGFFLMAGIVWLLKTKRWRPHAVFATIIGYLAVTVGTGIYVPFIIAATLVALAFGIGFVATKGSVELAGVWNRLVRLKWIFVAGVAAVVVLGVWALTRWDTIQGFTSTVYPGERLQTVGGSGLKDLAAFMGGPFAAGLGSVGGFPFGPNASEASTFLLPGLFLVIPLVWIAVDRFRRRQSGDWLVVALVIVLVLIFAYLVIPGWDWLAHLLLLDRTTGGRMRLAAGMLGVVMMAVMLAGSDRVRGADQAPASIADERRLPPRWTAIAATFASLLVYGVVLVMLYRNESPLVTQWLIWIPLVLATIAVVWFFARGRAAAGAALFAVVSIVLGAGVNPVYAGVYDLNGTTLVKTMKEMTAADPGRWVGVGDSALPTVALVQSGLPSLNGFQSTPSKKMWKEIDPSGDQAPIWNRLANVSWAAGEGHPAPFNPAPDQIRLTFDSCDAFAQQNVRYVLSDVPVDQACLTGERRVDQGPRTYYIYEVALKS